MDSEKLEDGFIRVQMKSPEGGQAVNLSSCLEEENGKEGKRPYYMLTCRSDTWGASSLIVWWGRTLGKRGRKLKYQKKYA